MKKRMIKMMILISVALSLLLLNGCGGKEEKTDLEYIKDKGTLIIGLDDTFAPMGFRDEEDNLVGFDIDLAKAVAKEMDIKVDFQPIEWKAKEAEMKSKNIDCVWNGMSATPERKKSMSLSSNYLENRILVMSLDQNINVKDAKNLKDYKVGTQAGSAALEAIQANEEYESFKDNISEYDTYDEAILDMKAGRIDVVVIDEVYAIYNNSNKDKLYESDFNFGSEYYAVGFRKDDKELTKEFNRALKEVVNSGKAAEISEKWFGKDMIAVK